MAGWETVKAIMDTITPIANIGLQWWNADENRKAQEKTNIENRNFVEKQNEITRQREDTAHTREVADLESAGLSPLANVNGAPTSTPLNSTLEAPQMDSTALNDAIQAFTEMSLRKDELKESKRQHDEKLTHEKKILEENKRQFEENKELTKQIENMNARNQIEQFLIQESRLNNEIELTAETKSREAKIRLSETTIQDYNNVCNKWSYSFKKKICTDLQEYLTNKDFFDKQLNNFIDWFKNKKEPALSTTTGKSKQESANTGFNAMGTGANFGTATGKSESGSQTFEGNWIKQGEMQKYIEQYLKEKQLSADNFKFPIYWPKADELNTGKRSYKTKGNWSYLK